MTTTHFAGVNTARLSRATEGRPILVSYADVIRRPGVWENEIRPRLEAGAYTSAILDSGAFTVISAGITIDVDQYAAFAAEFGHLFDVIVNLDDIAGDVATTAANQATLEAAGVDVLPVFHQGEDFDVLRDYVAKYGYVGVGFARKPGGRLARSTTENAAFLDEFFAIAGDVKTHGFAMTAFAKKGYAFTSVDSTSWIAEFCSLRSGRRDVSLTAPAAPKVLVVGELAGLLDGFGDDELLSLTLDSYSPPREADFTPNELGDAIEDQSRSQARTVFRRYGPGRLWTKITALDIEQREAA